METATSSSVKHYVIAKLNWKDKNFLGHCPKKTAAVLNEGKGS